jgi:hypothetical protein
VTAGLVKVGVPGKYAEAMKDTPTSSLDLDIKAFASDSE